MNAIQTFNFHSKEVRTATDLNGDVYFCLTDVADVLEISNANPSRFNLDEAGVHKMYISYPSGSKQVTFINEPNPPLMANCSKPLMRVNYIRFLKANKSSPTGLRTVSLITISLKTKTLLSPIKKMELSKTGQVAIEYFVSVGMAKNFVG